MIKEKRFEVKIPSKGITSASFGSEMVYKKNLIRSGVEYLKHATMSSSPILSPFMQVCANMRIIKPPLFMQNGQFSL